MVTGVRGINGEPGHQQALCQKAANAMDAARRAPVAADTGAGLERRLEEHVLSMVSRHER